MPEVLAQNTENSEQWFVAHGQGLRSNNKCKSGVQLGEGLCKDWAESAACVSICAKTAGIQI